MEMEIQTMENISGAGASGGKVTGMCISFEEYLENGLGGEERIIVADYIPPSITSLDEHVIGIIVEDGGILSHAACMAREFGIPCIVSVENALETLPGKRIEMDGSEGTICILTI